MASAAIILYSIFVEAGFRKAASLVRIFCEYVFFKIPVSTPESFEEEVHRCAVAFVAVVINIIKDKNTSLGKELGECNEECAACANTCSVCGLLLEKEGPEYVKSIENEVDDAECKQSDIIEIIANQIMDRRIVGGCGEGNTLRDDFANICRDYDGMMKQLFLDVGRNRFALTLLMAGCYESTTDLTWLVPGKSDKNEPVRKAVERKMKAVSRFIERVTNAVTIAPPGSKPDSVIAAVVDHFERHHRDSRHLAYKYGLELLLPKVAINIPLATTSQFLLMKKILWTLAVIGRPIEMEVLSLCSDIREMAGILLKENGHVSDNKNISSVIEQALGLCVARGLAFSLNLATDRYDSSDPIFPPHARFVVHRLLQRHLLAEMGASPQEAGEWGPYMLTLYASQSDELPQITHAAHERILDLIKELSCYPGFRTRIGILDDTLKNDDVLGETGKLKLKI